MTTSRATPESPWPAATSSSGLRSSARTHPRRVITSWSCVSQVTARFPPRRGEETYESFSTRRSPSGDVCQPMTRLGTSDPSSATDMTRPAYRWRTSRPTRERLALEVLVAARPFPDEHEARLRVPHAQNDVRPPLAQLAAAAVAEALADLGQARGRRLRLERVEKRARPLAGARAGRRDRVTEEVERRRHGPRLRPCRPRRGAGRRYPWGRPGGAGLVVRPAARVGIGPRGHPLDTGRPPALQRRTKLGQEARGLRPPLVRHGRV